MYLVCPKCLMAFASVPKKSGFKCLSCGHAWEPPSPEFADAYYHGLSDLQVVLVAGRRANFVVDKLPVELGRDSEFEELQRNLTVSRRHFRLDATGDTLLVTDLGSKTGTRLNGNLLPPNQTVQINPGDSLLVGGVTLRIELRFLPQEKPDDVELPGPADILLDSSKGITCIGEIESPSGPRLLEKDSRNCAACLYQAGVQKQWHVLALRGSCIRVNGSRVLDHELQEHDEITIGRYRYVFLKDAACLRPVSPPTAVGLAAHGVIFRAGGSGAGRVILNDVSVVIPPKQLTCIIGPSGSGKTTLVKILCGILAPDGGELEINGQHYSFDEYGVQLGGRIGLVPQDDVVHGELTVAQTMQYAAALRLPAGMGPSEKQGRILRILRELDLEHHANKRVGVLSGGQRKRVNVAIELLASPAILFLDEPTAGLDSATERQLVECLKRLARQGRTVVVVTHSLAAAEEADCVVLMHDVGNGGRVIGQGSPSTLKSRLGIHDWTEVFEETKPREISQLEKTQQHDGVASGVVLHAGRFFGLFLRYLNLWLSNPLALFVSLFGLPMLLGLLIRLAVPFDGPAGSDRFLFGVICAIWLGINQSVREIVRERSIILREQLAGIGPAYCLVSKLLFFVFAGAAQAIALIAPMAWLEGTDGSLHLAPYGLRTPLEIFWITLWTGLCAGTCLGLMISSFCLFVRGKGEIMAVLLGIVATLPQILFSEKVVGSLAEKTADYHSFIILDSTPVQAQLFSYLTLSRYLYLSLKATGLQKESIPEIFIFNGVIVFAFCAVFLILAWVAMQVFGYWRRRMASW